jgi:hypothetical protein
VGHGRGEDAKVAGEVGYGVHLWMCGEDERGEGQYVYAAAWGSSWYTDGYTLYDTDDLVERLRRVGTKETLREIRADASFTAAVCVVLTAPRRSVPVASDPMYSPPVRGSGERDDSGCDST